ncbi:MAG: hypothetical protein M5U18_18745 [Dehalococcoidia bacterium]|nr:hypothetical protein [Dehalococcoidia bacterium]
MSAFQPISHWNVIIESTRVPAAAPAGQSGAVFIISWLHGNDCPARSVDGGLTLDSTEAVTPSINALPVDLDGGPGTPGVGVEATVAVAGGPAVAVLVTVTLAAGATGASSSSPP